MPEHGEQRNIRTVEKLVGHPLDDLYHPTTGKLIASYRKKVIFEVADWYCAGAEEWIEGLTAEEFLSRHGVCVEDRKTLAKRLHAIAGEFSK